MKSIKKFTAGLMSVIMLSGVIAGCSSSDSEKKTTDEIPSEFTEDTEWYNVTKVDLSGQYTGPEYEYVDYQYIGNYNNGFIVKASGYKKVPENFDYENGDYSQFVVQNIDYYTEDGKLENSYSLDIPYDSYVMGAYVTDNLVTINYQDYTENNLINNSLILNLDSGEFSRGESFTAQEEGDYERTFIMGDLTIQTQWLNINDNTYSYIISVVDKDGNKTNIDLRDELPDTNIFDISQAFAPDADTILFQCSSGGSSAMTTSGTSDTLYVELDRATMKATVADSEKYGWLNNYDIWNATTIDGMGTYFVPWNGNGISKLDFENQTAETVINFNWCNVNRYDILNLTIVNADESGITLAGNTMDKTGFGIFKFEKAETNPNVGKNIIKAASLSGLDYTICEAIYEFNNQSSDTFIMVDNRYNLWENESLNAISGGGGEDDYATAYLNTVAEIADQMAVDIMAGDGPDLLFNSSSLTQLNNSDYLLDLSSLVADDSKYFTNITDSLKVDDKLYQLPVNFVMLGITTDERFVDDGQQGFTFEQYKTFVDEVCNGTDPIQATQLDYFDICYTAMTDLFYDGHSINFKNDDFTALAEYIKNDVKDPIPNSDDMYVDGPYYETEYEKPNASYGSIYSLQNLLWERGDDILTTRMLGLPTSDGRGPCFNIELSIAVSAQSKHQDSCLEFVNMLISDDFQSSLAGNNNTNANPVNRQAFEAVAQKAIESYNSDVDMNLQYYTDAELIMYSLPSKRIDDSVIDYYEGLIESCVCPSIYDPSIQIIMREEMQAYFAGQRDLATVEDTMTNRITTYINERG